MNNTEKDDVFEFQIIMNINPFSDTFCISVQKIEESVGILEKFIDIV